MGLTSEEIDSLRDGTLELHCRKITLVGGSQTEPKEISGPGYIRQLTQGGFEAVIYWEGAISMARVLGAASPQAGEVYTQDHSYSMTAVSVNWNRAWKAEGMDVQALIDAANKVRLLLYQLTFKLIGFSGQHTDYGTRGFPLMDYPPRNEP
jgi:hypothetical protein